MGESPEQASQYVNKKNWIGAPSKPRHVNTPESVSDVTSEKQEVSSKARYQIVQTSQVAEARGLFVVSTTGTASTQLNGKDPTKNHRGKPEKIDLFPPQQTTSFYGLPSVDCMEHSLDFIAGCIGGCAGVLVGHPFDTVKVRLQLQCSKNPLYKGTLDCFRKIIRKESPTGLYKGVTSPLYSLAFINAIVFGVQGNAIRRMDNPDSLWSHFQAGSLAGLVQCGICCPMELIKTRMQMQGQGEKRGTRVMYKGPVDCFTKIYRVEGVRGVTRGMGVTLVREVPAFGIYFLSYEWLCRQLTPSGMDHTPTSGLLVAGGLAGCASWLFSYPVDVIKSRIQADGIYKDGRFHYKYAGYRDCIRQSVAEEGWMVMSRGLNSTLIRAFPTNAATLTVVTWCLRYMRPDETEKEKKETIERATMIAQLEG